MATAKLKRDVLRSSIERQTTAPESFVQEEKYLNDEVGVQIRLEELNTIKEYNKALSQNNDERKKYAHKIFVLTILWSILIFIILFLIGWKLLYLSDKVIITLITSTTINFFGFFFLVTKYLFNTGLLEVIKKTKEGKKKDLYK